MNQMVAAVMYPINKLIKYIWVPDRSFSERMK